MHWIEKIFHFCLFHWHSQQPELLLRLKRHERRHREDPQGLRARVRQRRGHQWQGLYFTSFFWRLLQKARPYFDRKKRSIFLEQKSLNNDGRTWSRCSTLCSPSTGSSSSSVSSATSSSSTPSSPSETCGPRGTTSSWTWPSLTCSYAPWRCLSHFGKF